MFEKLQKALAKQLRIPQEKITLDSHIKDDLGADSLDVLQLLMTIEEEYNITIPEEELTTFSYVKDVVAYLEKLV